MYVTLDKQVISISVNPYEQKLAQFKYDFYLSVVQKIESWGWTQSSRQISEHDIKQYTVLAYMLRFCYIFQMNSQLRNAKTFYVFFFEIPLADIVSNNFICLEIFLIIAKRLMKQWEQTSFKVLENCIGKFKQTTFFLPFIQYYNNWQ